MLGGVEVTTSGNGETSSQATVLGSSIGSETLEEEGGHVGLAGENMELIILPCSLLLT